MSNPDSPVLVTEPRQLSELAAEWLEQPRLAVDTEFVRTRTYYPRLGLIQVSDGTGVWLVDTVALPDLDVLRPVLTGEGPELILHAPGEDLGVLLLGFGGLPQRIFDTQAAAALAGVGYSLAYQALVREILGVELEKGETRSNWVARPLSQAQVEYAAADVRHLHRLHAELADRLDRMGRAAWAREEFERMLDPDRYVVEPEDAWRRVKGSGGLDPRGAQILRRLSRWREEEARRCDLARPFVVRDASLLEIARRKPRKEEALREIRELRSDQRRRYGDLFLGVVREVAELPESGVPRVERRPRIAAQRDLTRHLQGVVAGHAARLDLAPEMLAQRRVLEDLVRRTTEGSTELPPELRGWRADVIGRHLVDALDEARD